jgi:hypothetical protein
MSFAIASKDWMALMLTLTPPSSKWMRQATYLTQRYHCSLFIHFYIISFKTLVMTIMNSIVSECFAKVFASALSLSHKLDNTRYIMELTFQPLSNDSVEEADDRFALVKLSAVVGGG